MALASYTELSLSADAYETRQDSSKAEENNDL
jgi:hypothetical protein